MTFSFEDVIICVFESESLRMMDFVDLGENVIDLEVLQKNILERKNIRSLDFLFYYCKYS